MKLMTEEIKRKLPKLYASEEMKAENIPVVVKFFNPAGAGTWYITEGEPLYDGPPSDGGEVQDWKFFGLCSIHEPELGYVLLSELEGYRGPFGLKIERDLHWNGTLKDAMTLEGI
jgi:hypothetical protein